MATLHYMYGLNTQAAQHGSAIRTAENKIGPPSLAQNKRTHTSTCYKLHVAEGDGFIAVQISLIQIQLKAMLISPIRSAFVLELRLRHPNMIAPNLPAAVRGQQLHNESVEAVRVGQLKRAGCVVSAAELHRQRQKHIGEQPRWVQCHRFDVCAREVAPTKRGQDRVGIGDHLRGEGAHQNRHFPFRTCIPRMAFHPEAAHRGHLGVGPPHPVRPVPSSAREQGRELGRVRAGARRGHPVLAGHVRQRPPQAVAVPVLNPHADRLRVGVGRAAAAGDDVACGRGRRGLGQLAGRQGVAEGARIHCPAQALDAELGPLCALRVLVDPPELCEADELGLALVQQRLRWSNGSRRLGRDTAPTGDASLTKASQHVTF